jgi:ABC-type amino acid transport system permease subunit
VKTGTIVLLVIVVLTVAALVALYFISKKAKKRQEETEQQMKASAQTLSMLIIDKKKMKIKEAGLPAVALESTPKYLRGMKVPVVKAKVGPKVMTLLCDEKVFPNIPVKKEVKAEVSGLYIIGVKGIRGPLETQKKEKKGLFAKFKKNK